MSEFYGQVPKTLAENLAYRIEIRERAEYDMQFRRALMIACKVDVLFFFNAFVFLYEPRPKFADGKQLPYTIPFITWEHQDPIILTLRKSLGIKDVLIEKSRGEGASWIITMLALHDWIFIPKTKIGLVSSTADKVDDPEDSDSLFWKLDWELTVLPTWMSGVKNIDYKRIVDKHSLTNLRNDSRINGYAATGDAGRGGRAAWFGMDELGTFPRPQDAEVMANVQAVTNSRLVVSTPNGPEGAYYEAAHDLSSAEKLILDWKDNPSRNRGLYEFKNGIPVACDPVDNPLPENYYIDNKELFSRLARKGYDLKKRQRSPWYDVECDRLAATPKSIAQDYDRDYGGSTYRFFRSSFFSRAEQTIHAPRIRGEISVDREELTLQFTYAADGPVHLWCPLDIKDKPPTHSYTVSADICTGVSGPFISNSVVTVIDNETMEQVLEYATNSTEPADFANVCIAICGWFNNAYLIWERNGPGKAFTERVKESHYSRLYRQLTQDQRGKKKTKKLGWWTDKATKAAAFSDLQGYVKFGKLQLRSQQLVRECAQYQIDSDYRIVHSGVVKSKDETLGDGHGDRVIAMALAVQGVKDYPSDAEPLKSDIPKELRGNCLASREALHELPPTETDGWNDMTITDMMNSPVLQHQ